MRWVLVFGIAARRGEGGCADDDFCIARVLLVYSLRAKHLSTREDVASRVYCGMVWLSLSLSSRATLTMSTQPMPCCCDTSLHEDVQCIVRVSCCMYAAR